VKPINHRTIVTLANRDPLQKRSTLEREQHD